MRGPVGNGMPLRCSYDLPCRWHTQLLTCVCAGQLTYATEDLRKRKGLAPLQQSGGDQFAAAAEFQVQPYLCL